MMTHFSCLANHVDNASVCGVSIEATGPDEANLCFFYMLNSFYVTGINCPAPIAGHPLAGSYLFTWIDSRDARDSVRLATIEAFSAEDAVNRLHILSEDGVLIVPAEPCG